jgi:GNAT superfamily N-acetyltransferase
MTTDCAVALAVTFKSAEELPACYEMMRPGGIVIDKPEILPYTEFWLQFIDRFGCAMGIYCGGIYMNIEIKKLTPDLAEDYVQFFDETPHNQKYRVKCYCVCWCGNEPERTDCSSEEKRRAVALEFVKAGNLQGYLAYSGSRVVGWCNANTKSDCLTCGGWRYAMGSVPTDELTDKRVKSIFCFTIAPDMQQKGIATSLLERVCQDAAQDGFLFAEAYPNKTITDESENFVGYTEMFEKMGFTVYKEPDSIYVMRKKLQG